MDTWLDGGRNLALAEMDKTQEWDMVVIGGGITGAGVAREASRQGLRVLLIEQKDFAWGTSSRSSKMVHGGLRYLASGNLKLTSHSVKERERLMNEAPGLVDLMSYIWPHYKGSFPGPKIFNGLLAVYDSFAGKRYRHFLNASDAGFDLPYIKKEGLIGATRFADAVTDDSRLVIRVLREAIRVGTVAINYMEAGELIRENEKVVGVVVNDDLLGVKREVRAKVVVSATGAWADKFRKNLGAQGKIRPLRGSHLVVPSWRLPISQSITLHHPHDNRALFIFPWEGMTVIGTTDLDNPALEKIEPSISNDEVGYLLDAAASLFPSAQLTRDDIIATFAGVRPIVSSGSLNPSAEKRDHTIWDDHGLITVSGGKLTTFRLIALDVLKAASHYLPQIDWRDHNQNIFTPMLKEPKALEKIDKHWRRRLMGFYGVDIETLCNDAEVEDWALVPGTFTFWAQVRYAANHEAVEHLDDLMLRRTRLGLFLKDGGNAYKSRIKQICQQGMNWDDAQWDQEWNRYQDIWRQYYSIPQVA